MLTNVAAIPALMLEYVRTQQQTQPRQLTHMGARARQAMQVTFARSTLMSAAVFRVITVAFATTRSHRRRCSQISLSVSAVPALEESFATGRSTRATPLRV